MTLKNTLTISSAIAVMTVLMCLFFASTSAHADGSTVQVFFKIATSSPEVVSTASVTVAATSTGRTFLKLSNNSSNPLFCNYGKTAVGNQGFLVNASSSYTMNGFTEPIYTGSVNCIASSTSQVYVMANQ